MLLSKIPGLTKAVAKAAAIEDTIRRRAFLPHVTTLCGLAVRPFTPRHFLFLDEARSPFLSGHIPGPEHVGIFLWLVSTDFVLPSPQIPLSNVRQRRHAFTQRIGRIPFIKALTEIGAYLDEALLDRPGGGGGDDPIASFAAVLVDDIAAAYGWQDEILDADGQPVHGAGILDKPIARLCQYRRLIWRRDCPSMPVTNRLCDTARRKAVENYLEKEKKPK